jgi:integrase
MTTINDILDRYMNEELAKLSYRTQIDYLRHIQRLRDEFGTRNVDDIRPRDIGQFLDVKKGKIQRAKIVSVLSSVYTLAVGQWWLAEKNPCLSVMKPKANVRKRYVTDEEFAAVRGICQPRLQAAMDLALLTGQRQGDILGLRWDNIDVNGRVIYVRQGKTGKLFGISISEALEEVLVRCKRMTPALPRDYVLRQKSGERYTSEGFRAMWNRKIKQAFADGLIESQFTFHDLRAKAASDSDNMGSASALLGHQDERITRRVYDRSIRIVAPLR